MVQLIVHLYQGATLVTVYSKENFATTGQVSCGDGFPDLFIKLLKRHDYLLSLNSDCFSNPRDIDPRLQCAPGYSYASENSTAQAHAHAEAQNRFVGYLPGFRELSFLIEVASVTFLDCWPYRPHCPID